MELTKTQIAEATMYYMSSDISAWYGLQPPKVQESLVKTYWDIRNKFSK